MTSVARLLAAAAGPAALLAPLAAQAAAAGQPAVVAGRAFEVRCHGGDEAVARLALAAVEPVWPELCAFFGAPPAPPRQRLQVHLYVDVKDYRDADRRLTGGRFLRNEAMSHWDTRSAHVALQPPCPEALLAARGLPLQTEAMLAWEASHVARYELCANFQLHPGWFHDGLAGVVARRTLQRRRPQLDAPPFFTQRWLRAQRLARDGRLPGARQLLTDETQDLAMRDRYAARVSFFAFAAERAPDALRAVAQLVRGTKVGAGYAGEVAAAATASLSGLDRAFQRALQDDPIAWDEQVRSLWCVGDEWTQRAFPQADAVAVRREPVGSGRLRATGQVCVLDVGARRARLLLGLDDRGGYSLSLCPGEGFELQQLGPQGEAQGVVARGACAELRCGAFCPLELSFEGRRLELQLGGRRQRIALPRALPPETRWGIAAAGAGVDDEYGSVVVWRGLRVRGV